MRKKLASPEAFIELARTRNHGFTLLADGTFPSILDGPTISVADGTRKAIVKIGTTLAATRAALALPLYPETQRLLLPAIDRASRLLDDLASLPPALPVTLAAALNLENAAAWLASAVNPSVLPDGSRVVVEATGFRVAAQMQIGEARYMLASQSAAASAPRTIIPAVVASRYDRLKTSKAPHELATLIAKAEGCSPQSVRKILDALRPTWRPARAKKEKRKQPG